MKYMPNELDLVLWNIEELAACVIMLPVATAQGTHWARKVLARIKKVRPTVVAELRQLYKGLGVIYLPSLAWKYRLLGVPMVQTDDEGWRIP